MKIAHHTWYAWWPGRLIVHKPIWSVLDFLPPFEGHHHQIWVENLWREFCCKSFTVVNSGSSNSLEWDIREYWGFGLWVIIILPICVSTHLLVKSSSYIDYVSLLSGRVWSSRVWESPCSKVSTTSNCCEEAYTFEKFSFRFSRRVCLISFDYNI